MSSRFCTLLVLLSLLIPLLISGCSREVPVEEPVEAAAEPEQPASDPAAELAAARDAERWRAERLERLTRPDGWLTLVALEWLEEGGNTIGGAESNDIVLPEEKVPARLGTIHLSRGDAAGEEAETALRFEPAPGASLTVDGEPVTETIDLQTDQTQHPTILASGPVSFFVIQRGDRLGIRARDREAATRVNFPGLEYFDDNPAWRVEARFEPYDPPKGIPIADITGDVTDEPSPGALVFEHEGTTIRIDALDGGPDELFLIIADETSGAETYGAGRYLYVPRPDPDGIVPVDFNRAYNPPCVFTDFATCPLPPRQNRIPFRVDAGEKNFGAAH
ncbi:MAG TPA: DUF1684 domain-containing protein [Thermoanaerobaculia bacterium]|nr:DUF1684 domain-containing protein [Thermoanaerobaculia bacterium]